MYQNYSLIETNTSIIIIIGMKQLIIYIYVHINDIPKQNFHSEKKWIAIYNFSGIVSY